MQIKLINRQKLSVYFGVGQRNKFKKQRYTKCDKPKEKERVSDCWELCLDAALDARLGLRAFSALARLLDLRLPCSFVMSVSLLTFVSLTFCHPFNGAPLKFINAKLLANYTVFWDSKVERKTNQCK